VLGAGFNSPALQKNKSSASTEHQTCVLSALLSFHKRNRKLFNELFQLTGLFNDKTLL
jgi:hypothetical protein